MLKEIKYPPHRRYKSRTQWEPIGFFSDGLCNAYQFDLMLGFFSSSAISVLSCGFASFLYRGGKMRLIINDILTEEDKQAVAAGMAPESLPYFDLSNIHKLRETLSSHDQHFFECLAWLIRNNRIEIRAIKPRNGQGISHTKCGIFRDGINRVSFDGSCNFSKAALVDNIESISVACDWDGALEETKVSALELEFDSIFDGTDSSVEYVEVDDIRTQLSSAFENKEIKTLLEDEISLLLRKRYGTQSQTISDILQRAQDHIEQLAADSCAELPAQYGGSPSFPYNSKPREYQQKAFENWKANKQKGLFAMATGTGKTITALNCLLEIYNRCGYYKAIILVPTITLVEQWEKECRKFNFNKITKVFSKNPAWRSSLESIELGEKLQGPNNTLSYVVITTYASFIKDEAFKNLTIFPKSKVLFIADEAHNMGSKRILEKMSAIPYLRRIGLSATPERQFDEEANERVFDFFGVSSQYTFEYSMERAINNGDLCRYYYYPHLVRLTVDEMKEYQGISNKIVKYYNGSKFVDNDDILTALLLKRKRIIHKAANKASVFKSIITERFMENGHLKYTLVYVPEGLKPDTESADYFDDSEEIANDSFSDSLIDEYTSIVRDIDSHITVSKFTSNSRDRESMLQSFACGEIHVLTSMKCLDEGVDVPRSELAIFCASTGNPRQFIQRRGRILRKHPDKHIAIIHDLVVAPEVNSESSSFAMERNLISNELRRVRNFSLLSENSDDTLKELEEILDYYHISIF